MQDMTGSVSQSDTRDTQSDELRGTRKPALTTLDVGSREQAHVNHDKAQGDGTRHGPEDGIKSRDNNDNSLGDLLTLGSRLVRHDRYKKGAARNISVQ